MAHLVTLISFGRRIVATIVGVTIAILLVIMIGQIVLSYGFNSSLIWAEEGCRYLLIWVSFLSAAAAFERGELAAVTMLRDMLPRKAGLALAIVAHLFSIVLLCVLVWYGISYAQRIGSQPIPALSFLLDDIFGGEVRAPAMFWVYLALPVGMALLAATMFADMVRCVLAFGSGGHAGDPYREPAP